jgi:hypothetical protein
VVDVEVRLKERARRPVGVDNPDCAEQGAIAFADPDGWIVVRAPWAFGFE